MFSSFLKLGQKSIAKSDFYSFLLAYKGNLKEKEIHGNKFKECLKTDKGNAKLNSWYEKEGTMKPSKGANFGENFNFTISFLTCLFFSPQICSMESLKAFLLFLISFPFLLCGIYFWKIFLPMLKQILFASFVSDT